MKIEIFVCCWKKACQAKIKTWLLLTIFFDKEEGEAYWETIERGNDFIGARLSVFFFLNVGHITEEWVVKIRPRRAQAGVT
ncbi:Uncharacterized protein APZ42_015576 [Daphnia magna]|uniref:Uncharacterized protein n=1 Tax=Daphnia magna TaxID=35525 RepID=A0A162NVG6_9CRUS|nr:Uncharacterized protein APZ42_015576 [Daphnia magna]